MRYNSALMASLVRVQLHMPQTSALVLELAQDFMRRAANVDLHQCPFL